MVSSSDMMMARDAVAQAWNAWKAAEARGNAEVSMANCQESARWKREWRRRVMDREAMERKMWREQDRAAAQVSA